MYFIYNVYSFSYPVPISTSFFIQMNHKPIESIYKTLVQIGTSYQVTRHLDTSIKWKNSTFEIRLKVSEIEAKTKHVLFTEPFRQPCDQCMTGYPKIPRHIVVLKALNKTSASSYSHIQTSLRGFPAYPPCMISGLMLNWQNE